MLKRNRLLLICFASLLISLPYWVQRFTSNAKTESEHFQTTLSKKEVQAKEDLIWLKSLSPDQYLEKLTQEKVNGINEGISLFVYQEDKLLAWSDDEASFQQPLNKQEEGLFISENAIYELIKQQKDKFSYVALILIKHDYRFENRYLQNQFQKDFRTNNLDLSFTEEKGEFKILGSKKEHLFSLYRKQKDSISLTFQFFLIFLFSIGALSLFTVMQKWPFGVQLLIAFMLRVVLFYYPPDFWSSWDIFQPSVFAVTQWVPSLGDLLLHIFFLFFILYRFKQHFHYTKRIWLIIFEIIIGLSMMFFTIFLIKASVQNSIIPFNLNDLFQLTEKSYLSFLIFGSGFFMALILFDSALSRLWKYYTKHSIRKFSWKRGPILPIVSLLFFSGISIYMLEESMLKKQLEEKQFILQKLAEEKDPIAEYLFLEIQQSIKNDTTLHTLLLDYWNEREKADNYLRNKYFDGYWKKYNFIFTPCLANDSLYLSTGNTYTACRDYFMERLRREGELISSTNFFQLKNFPGRIEYLAEVEIPINSQTYTLYIELLSNLLSEGQGYPELLLDAQSKADDLDLGAYAYAIYEKGELIYTYGNYNYPTQLIEEKIGKEEFITMEEQEYWHTTYSKNGKTVLVLSQEKKNWLSSLTAWAYLFVIYSALFLVCSFTLSSFPFHLQLNFTDFSTKLQLFLVGTLLFALLSFSMGTIYYIQQQYKKKNFNSLREKVRSINMELEQKLATEEVMAIPLKAYVEGLLIKFSNVFYTDINLYTKEGSLYASSRPEVFNHGLKSNRMNPLAYQKLYKENRSEWVQEESIGEMKYLSAYIPFRNYNNEVLAYLNLPYFSKQDEFQEELSSFIVSTLNIYVGIFTLALLVSVLLVNQLSKPLLLIRKQIGRLKLGSSVELIKWDSKDEIGALVNEYNRIAIELNESAELLAQSEREGAWREMAKQVAHEIKNPLTPMKLSIQHLQMAVKANPDHLQERLERTAQTLIQQIDTLSNIANAFSSFAKLPEKDMQQLDLLPILETSAHLYESEVKVVLEIQKEIKEAFVLGDKDQLLRLFNNLLKNAVYATQGVEGACIEIALELKGEHYLISISDNGIGIPKEQQERIFEPNFTTKSSGTGLGLAMAKSIVKQMGGNISVESEEGEGARFFIQLKKNS